MRTPTIPTTEQMEYMIGFTSVPNTSNTIEPTSQNQIIQYMRTATLPSASISTDKVFKKIFSGACKPDAPQLVTLLISRAKRAYRLLAALMVVLLLSGSIVLGQTTTLATYYFENNPNPQSGAIGSPSLTFNSTSYTNSTVCQGTYSIGADANGDYVELTIATTGYRNISVSWSGCYAGNYDSGNQWRLTGNDGNGYGSTLLTQDLQRNTCAGASYSLGNSFSDKTSIKIRLTYVDSGKDGRLDQLVIAGTEICDATLATTPGSRCGIGTVGLSVTPSGCFTSTIGWYAATTGGASLGSGISFTTPSISTSTTYYAQENLTGGLTSFGAGTSGSTNRGLVFNLYDQIILNSVQIETGSSFPIVIGLRDNSGAAIGGISDVTITTNSGVQTVPLNWTISTGTGYRLLLITNNNGVNLTRTENFTSWPSFGIGAITGNFDTGGTDRYNFFYNWSLSRVRVGVLATIQSNSATPIITGTYCPGGTSVTGTSSETNGTNIIVYKAGNTLIGTATVSSGTWTATVVALAASDVVTATATASGKCVSATSSGKMVNALPSATIAGIGSGSANVSCYGGTDGTVKVTASAGSGSGYEFWIEGTGLTGSWTIGASNPHTFTGGLKANILYTVKVKDSLGCESKP